MRKLMWFTVGFGLSCLLAAYLLPERILFRAALVLVCLAAAAWFPLKRCRPARLLIAGLALGMVWCWTYSFLVVRPAHVSAGTREISATVCDYSVETDYGISVFALAEVDGQSVKTQFFLFDKELSLQPGDVITGSFELSPSDRTSDGSRWVVAQANGVLLFGSGREVTVSRPERIGLRYLPQRANHALQALLSETVPPDAAGFVRAIVTGDKNGLSDADRNALSASGVSHVIAVSGMHVGFLLALLVLLMGRGGWIRATVQSVILLAFQVLTGASPSVLRATVMMLLYLYAPCLRRTFDWPTALSAAALFILVPNPWAAANVSFQLSFCAVTGLLLIGVPLHKRLRAHRISVRVLHWDGPAWLPEMIGSRISRAVRAVYRYILGCVSATVGVLILSTPLTALIFGEISVYAILSNLLVVFAAPFCFAGGLLCIVLGAIWAPLGGYAGWLTAWPVRWILFVCRGISELPFARLSAASAYGIGFLAAAYVSLFLFWRGKGRLLRPAVEILLCLVIACVFTRLSRQDVPFSVTALDVGQGQCLILRAEGFCAMVDCGGTNGSRAGIHAADYLNSRGIDRLDALVLSHYDADHIGGTDALLDRMYADAIYLPDVPFDPEKRAWVEHTASDHGVPVVYVTEDLSLEVPGGTMQIFAPVSMYDGNAASLSVLFSVGECDMLTTGDMDFYAEYDLLLTHDLPGVEIFAAGHHGSRHSNSPELLDTIRPQTVLISAGKDNRYGHPDPETLERFAWVGAEVYRTDELGDIETGR